MRKVVNKKPSGVKNLLDYLGKHKGPRSKSSMREEKDLLFKEYRAGSLSIGEYNKALEKLVMKKRGGYPALPPSKPGVDRKLFGGKEARQARRAERQEDRQERRGARRDARQEAKEQGVGFFGRIGAGFQAGRDMREQQQMEGIEPELEETDPAMTGAIGGGVDTSAAGAGMDSGGAMAAKRGGLKDRRRKKRKARRRK